MYTVKNCPLDDNGQYHRTNKIPVAYFAKLHENGITVNSLSKDDPAKPPHYKKRMGRGYSDVFPDQGDLYNLYRYYRHSKVIPGLKMTVLHAESLDGTKRFPYWCVVYSLNTDADDVDVKEIHYIPHGNSKRPKELQQPYVRTNPGVLKQIDDKLETCDSPYSVFMML